MSVFAILAGGVAGVAASGLGLARNNRERSVAANLASEDIDTVHSMQFSALAALQGTSNVKTVTVGGNKFFVRRTVSWTTINATTSICNYSPGGSTQSWVLGITTAVTWPSMATSLSGATATTTISPPVGYSGTSNVGTIPVRVYDADGDKAPGVPVSVTDGASHTYGSTTDGNGCAFLVVSPATYTVSLSQAGSVDRTANPTPSAVITVSSGGSTPVSFDYDVGRTLTVTPSSAAGLDPPTGVPVTLAYQFFTPAGKRVFTTTSWPAAIAGLFPDPYTAWVGDCADADPQWWGGARPQPVDLGPGGAPITVPIATVAISATSGGLPLSGATVTAKETSGGCPAGSPSVTGFTLGTTDGTGALQAALPWGKWQISVSGGGSATVNLDADAGSTSFPVAVGS